MPYLIKQFLRAEGALSHKEAKKVLKKVERLDGHVYVEPNDKSRLSEESDENDQEKS